MKDTVWVSTLLVDQVIEDKTGVLTLVRLIDRLDLQMVPIGPPGVPMPQAGEIPPPVARVNLVTLLKQVSGEAQSIELSLVLRSPTGQEIGSGGSQIVEISPERGLQALVPTDFAYAGDGRYVFEVVLDGEVRSQAFLDVTLVRPGPEVELGETE